MARILQLEIKNFRGIKDLTLNFPSNRNLVCFIGRGDSGKSTILEAISSVLSPNWNKAFYDSDFYNCKTQNEISIELTLFELPEKFITDRKYGLHLREYNRQSGTISNTLSTDKEDKALEPALTIKLIVDKDLEPSWKVTSKREQEEIPISATDRALFNCFLISDYFDRHFNWNKGNPLYSILKSIESVGAEDEKNVILNLLRDVKDELDSRDFSSLKAATEVIKQQTVECGLNIASISTTLDSRELFIKDGRLSLHDDIIPFRSMGKGSRRLASLAIQTALVKSGGIMLVDEVEQGLEPERIKTLVSNLNNQVNGQIFITTHSRDVIIELGTEPLFHLVKDTFSDEITLKELTLSGEELQKAVRACPEAFFAKKVIVCEGATEVGICRALDKWRKQQKLQQMTLKDCTYVNGEGNNLVSRVLEISECIPATALFCDSDDSGVNDKKADIEKNASIFDSDEDLCIEQQVFKDLCWEGVIELLSYSKDNNRDSFNSTFSSQPTEIGEWSDSEELRGEIISKFKPKNGTCSRKWFKSQHDGEALGNILFKYINQMDDTVRLKSILNGLSAWIDS